MYLLPESISLSLMIAISAINSSEDLNDMSQPEKSWTGLVNVACLQLFPEEQKSQRLALIKTRKSWLALWKYYKPDTSAPEIDFDQQLVVVVKNVRYLNRISLESSIRSQGTLTVQTKVTRSARPVRDAIHLLMMTADRDGLLRVQHNLETVEIND